MYFWSFVGQRCIAGTGFFIVEQSTQIHFAVFVFRLLIVFFKKKTMSIFQSINKNQIQFFLPFWFRKTSFFVKK